MTITIEDIGTLGTVLSVWAHPDDESFLASGLMAAAAAAAQRVVCVTATAGEQGTTAAHPDPATLGGVRRRELVTALAKLGVHEHVMLGLPDGGCATLVEDAPIERLRRIIRWFGADTIVTFGPDGMTGHPDHCAVSRWVDLAVTGNERPIRVLHAAPTARDRVEFADVLETLGLPADGATAVVEPDDITVEIVLDARLLARKVAALRSHTSQTAALFEAIPLSRLGEWLRVEAFVDATN